MPTPLPTHGVCLRQCVVGDAGDEAPPPLFLRTHPVAEGQARGAIDATAGPPGPAETLSLAVVVDAAGTPVATMEELSQEGAVIALRSRDGALCLTAQEDGTVHLDSAGSPGGNDDDALAPQQWRFVAAERGSLADPARFHIMSCAFGTWLHVGAAADDGARAFALSDPPTDGMPDAAWAFDVVDAPEPTAAPVVVTAEGEADETSAADDKEDGQQDAAGADDDAESAKAANDEPEQEQADAANTTADAAAAPAVEGESTTDPAEPQAAETDEAAAANGVSSEAGGDGGDGGDGVTTADDGGGAEGDDAAKASDAENDQPDDKAGASAAKDEQSEEVDPADAGAEAGTTAEGDNAIPEAADDEADADPEPATACPPAAAPVIPPGASYATPYKREVHLGPHARPDEEWTDSAMSPLMVRYVARHSLVDLLNDMVLSVVATQPPSEQGILDHLMAFLQEVEQLQRRPPTPPHTPIPADATPDLVPAPPPRSAKKAVGSAATPRRYGGGGGTGSPLRGSPRKADKAAASLGAAANRQSLQYTEDEAAVKVQSVVRRGIASDRVKSIKDEQQQQQQQHQQQADVAASNRSDSPPRAALIAAASLSATSPTLAAAAAMVE